MIQLNRYASSELELWASGVPEGADALIVVRALRQRIQAGLGARAVFIARDDRRAYLFRKACQFFAADMAVLWLPAWDCQPFDRLSPGRSCAAERAACLYGLSHLENHVPVIIVTTLNGISQYVPPKEVIAQAGLRVHVGESLADVVLENFCRENGYARASIVGAEGEYARRGGVVDIFAPTLKQPVRLDFFGKQIESIRYFDIDSQRSLGEVQSLDLAPVSEILWTDSAQKLFRKHYMAAFGSDVHKDAIYESVSDGRRIQGIEHYLPFFYIRLDSIFDYVGPQAFYVCDTLFMQTRQARWEDIQDLFAARMQALQDRSSLSGSFRPVAPDRLYMAPQRWAELTADLSCRYHSDFKTEGNQDQIDFGGRSGRHFAPERQMQGGQVFAALSAHLKVLQAAGKKVLMAAWTIGGAERLGHMLEDHDIPTSLVESVSEAFSEGHAIVRIVLPLEQGFEFDNITVLSESDIFGERLVHRMRARRAKHFISEISNLQAGDLIVHIDHGLGRYVGLKMLDVQGQTHDFLELEYADGQTLYLPVENIELLSRYGSEAQTVRLDRLGSVAWQSRKAKAKARLQDLAAELIKTAAERTLRVADPINIESGDYEAFCARFAHTETEDQLQAIEDVLEDLRSGQPMDRLICGDVGFGKTEVALRASFAVAMSAQQVALIAPTTLLARQHYANFQARFRGWPLKVAALSRLVKKTTQTSVRDGLKQGQIDIVIGTHALLAKTIKFANLGMVIIDEEHRFGVTHKEQLKKLRAQVHVLTLSATPIPRTLQLCLSGIRDLSLMATPPVDRLAVRTYVSAFDVVSLRKAILREHFRGGQSFIVVPRISDLVHLQTFLSQNVPEVSYLTAHGQLGGQELDEIMNAFYEGHYNVLLSTSIIESGIDIPSANTLIIYRADRFGLAQLYQMRGRVGRSKVRAYAYLTLPGSGFINESAVQRLKVLQTLDSLGAGFNLASYDLDMRGAGNPLGEAQSGHMKDVGVELYQHMLEEAISLLREGESARRHQSWSPQINVGMSSLIPNDYMPDLNLRLATYRRIAEIENETDSAAFAAELIDRFGTLPLEIESLLSVMTVKSLCRQAHIEKVDVGDKAMVLTMRAEDISDPVPLVTLISEKPNWRLRPDQSLLIKGVFPSSERFKALKDVLNMLIKVWAV